MKKLLSILTTIILVIYNSGCTQLDEKTVAEITTAAGNAAAVITAAETALQTANDILQPQASAETESAPSQFDFERKVVMLNSGYEMPILGLGMFSLSDNEAENSTYWALKHGFRLIDTARIYGNEEAVGRGLRRAIDEGIVSREDVFITTKMWTSDYGDGAAAIDASLSRLGVDYIDLMILHHSQPSNDVDAYKAMEQAVRDGKLRSIGLSNYYEPEDFDRVVNATTIKPALMEHYRTNVSKGFTLIDPLFLIAIDCLTQE